MSTPVAPRPSLDTRPIAPQLAEFESLDHAHQAALRMLESFERLVTRLDDNGLDAEVQAHAREILAFFDGPGRNHHADEERHVFPGLLSGADPELIQHVRRLQQDHGWLEEDWRELHPQIEAVAGGYSWYDIATLKAALPVFSTLYRDHIALEESLIYPAAKRQREAMLAALAQREHESA